MADGIKLKDEHRSKLDGIVQKMIANNESDETIQFLVADFKSKYGEKKKDSLPAVKSGLPPLNSGSSPFQSSKPLAPTVLSGEKQQEFTEKNKGYVAPKAEEVSPVFKPELYQAPTEQAYQQDPTIVAKQEKANKPKETELTFAESTKNTYDNFTNSLKGVLPRLSTVSTTAFEKVIGKELTNKLTSLPRIEFTEDGIDVVSGRTLDEIRNQSYQELDFLASQTKQTEGIVENLNNFDIVGLSAGIVDAVGSLASTIVPSLASGGSLLVTEMVGGSLHDYNTAKAKHQGITTKELFENGDADFGVPAIIGSVAFGMEKIGLKGLSNAMTKRLVGGGFKKALLLGGEWNKEGATEWVQVGLDEANLAVANGLSPEKVAEVAIDAMFSPKGLEAYAKGVVGSGAATGLGRGAKALLNPKNKAKATKLDEQKAKGWQDLANDNISPEAKSVIVDAMEETALKADELANQDRKEAEALTPEQKVKAEELTTKIAEVEAVIAEPSVSESTKGILEEQVKELENELSESIKPVAENKPLKTAEVAEKKEKPVQKIEVFTEHEQALKTEQATKEEPTVSKEKESDIIDVTNEKPEKLPTKLEETYKTPLEMAEFDLTALKKTENKAKKYEASIKRLIEAKKAKQISPSEFDEAKARFDDVLAEANVKAPKVEDKPADEEIQEEPESLELNTTQVPDGKGSWRGEFNKETDAFRKSDILRAIADVSTDVAELNDIRKAVKGMPEESNIIHAVEQKEKAIAKQAEKKAEEPVEEKKVAEAPKEEAKPEIKKAIVQAPQVIPNKDVKANQKLASQEISKARGIKDADGEALFAQFKNKRVYNPETDGQGSETPADTFIDEDKIPPILKGVFKRLEDNGLIEEIDGGFYLTDKGKNFNDAVQARLDTRKGIKAGTDMFPTDANLSATEKLSVKPKPDSSVADSGAENATKTEPFVSKTKIELAKEKLAQAKAKLKANDVNLAIYSDPKEKARDLLDYHKALVDVAKAYIETGIETVEAFAKEIGEKLNKGLIDAWEEAKGGKTLTEKDFEEAPKVKSSENFTQLVHKNIQSDEIRNTLNNIERETGKELSQEEKEYRRTNRMEALAHGTQVVESAKSEFGDNYVSDLLAYLKENGSTISVENKSLITIALELDLDRRLLAEPENELTLNKQLKLVQDVSIAQQRSAAIATGYGILRQIARVGYDISEVTEQFFSTDQQVKKAKVVKAVQADADAINKEAESKEAESEVEEGELIVEKPKVVRSRKIVDAEIKDTLKGLRAALLKAAKGGFGAQAALPFQAQIVAATPFIIKLSKLLSEKGVIVTKELVAEIQKEIKQYIPKIKATDIEQVLRAEQIRQDEAKISAAIKAIEKSIAELEQKLADNDLSTDTKTESLWSTELGKLKAKQVALQGELADRRKAAKPKAEPKEREPLTNEQKLATAKRNIRESIENIDQEIAEKKRILKLTNKTVADAELIQLQAEKDALVKLRDNSDFGKAFLDEKAKEAIAKRLTGEVEKINEQIIAGEKAEREAKKDPYESEKINKLKAEKKARLAVLEQIDPTPKQFIKDALIEAGFGREITVTTKDGKEKRQIIDWKKLAGEEGSEAKLQAHVEKALTDKGYSAGEILRMQDAFVQEYRELRADILKKALKELNELNTVKPPVDYRSSAKRLAELYNLGLFEKESDTYDYLMNKALGMSELSQENFFKAKELAKVLSDLYQQKNGDQAISEFGLSHAITDINKQIERLLAGIAWHEGNGLYKASMIAREIFGMSQRALLQSMKQALENPVSGYFERGFNKLTYGREKNDTKELKKQRAEFARNMFSDAFSNAGMDYGNLNNPFLSKSHTEDWLNGLSRNKGYHRILSAALGKAYLEGVDGMHKVVLTEGYFTRNLIKILTSPSNPNGAMSHDDAVKYVSEQLTGQKFEDALVTAKQVIDNINRKAGREVLKTNAEYVNRLAQGIVKDALAQGSKLTLPQIEASFKAGYFTAGHGLGHEQNNIVSWGVGLLNHAVESQIKQSVKDKDWTRAAVYTFMSVMTKNIINPFVGGGMNWVTLTLQKSGVPLGIAEALVNRGKALDLTTDHGIRDMEKALAGSARAKSALGRVYLGAALSFIVVASMKASGEEEEIEKWLKANPVAAKYLKILSPQALIATLAMQSDEMGKYFQHLFNIKVDAFDDMVNVSKGVTGVLSANPVKKTEGWGRLGAVIGGHVSTPVLPFKMGKDLKDIASALSGRATDKTDYNVSGFSNGFFRTGLVEFMGLRPAPTYKEQLVSVIPKSDSKTLKFLQDKKLDSGQGRITADSNEEIVYNGATTFMTAKQAGEYNKVWNETFYKQMKAQDLTKLDDKELKKAVKKLKDIATFKARKAIGVYDAKMAEITIENDGKYTLDAKQVKQRLAFNKEYFEKYGKKFAKLYKDNQNKLNMSDEDIEMTLQKDAEDYSAGQMETLHNSGKIKLTPKE